MQTLKSAIQLKGEQYTRMGLFKTALRNLSDSYEITESVFGIYGGKPAELEAGYLELDKEYNSIDEALDNIWEDNHAVYIVSPEQVLTGTVRKNLSECNSLKNVLDISTLEMIHR